jgi:hypothetical protein
MGHILVGESFVAPPADVTAYSGASHRPLRGEASYVKDSRSILIACSTTLLRRFTALPAVDADALFWGAVERVRLAEAENCFKRAASFSAE